MAPLTNTDLFVRDNESIEYTKSLLEEGDTLVFIKYPGDISVYDPTGSHLKPQTHRVHSEKLLSTGSAKFAKLLSDDWKQHLMRKRNGFLNKEALPRGVAYVLDLTPPDEGDEAVDLISDLSCSAGIRNWYSSMKRCGVHKKLVGGKDDICQPKGFSVVTEPQSIVIPPVDTAPSVVGEKSSDDQDKLPSVSPQHDGTIPNGRPAFDINEENLQEALERSREEQRLRQVSSSQYDPNGKDSNIASEEVEEYCPIRHRAGIQGLLQVIEGKVPKLDSAPKVWTLMGVAKYFECTHIVVSWALHIHDTRLSANGHRWILFSRGCSLSQTLNSLKHSQKQVLPSERTYIIPSLRVPLLLS